MEPPTELPVDHPLCGVDTTRRDLAAPNAMLHYYERFLSREYADFYFESFEVLPFAQGYVRSGRENRLSVMYSELRGADGELRDYYYSGKRNPPRPFTEELLMLKASVEMVLGVEFNSCLVNYYADGRHNIGWHSDSEKSLKPGSIIASVSLGAERWFDVRANEGAYETRIRTAHGSLIVMGGDMQKLYRHRIAPESKVLTPRINLTFRQAI